MSPLLVRVLVLVLLAAGCSQSTGLDKAQTNFDGGNGSGPIQCMTNDECALGAATCCECPTFAVPVGDPAQRACSQIMCPPSTCPNNVAAVCSVEGQCELACLPMTCPTTCATGYATDASGCLTCACAPAVNGGCMGDGDCLEVPADCCGCSHGGIDTAVLASQASAFEASLGCPTAPQCPSVNTCDPATAPHCVQGSCALTTGTLPPNACGRADLPPCPAGQQCVVNFDNVATMDGVGVCTP